MHRRTTLTDGPENTGKNQHMRSKADWEEIYNRVGGGCRACDWVENRKRAKSLLAPGMYSRCAHYVYMFGDLATDVTRCRRSIPTDRLKIIGEISE